MSGTGNLAGMVVRVPANWYPDPTGRHHLRYWDGLRWTDHVVFQNVQSLDPLSHRSGVAVNPQVPVTQAGGVDRKIVRQVRKARIHPKGWKGGGTLLTERVLVINQKPKRFERLAEYAIFDQEGRRLGEVRETGNFLISAVTMHPSETRRRTLEVADHAGRVLYRLKRPAKIFKPQVELSYADGIPIGRFSQNRLFSRKLSLEVGEGMIGDIALDHNAFRAKVRDPTRREIASISRTWAGRRAVEKTRADNYVIEIFKPALEDPLLGFVVTAAVAIDTLFQQGEPTRGDAKREHESRRRYGAHASLSWPFG